MRSPVSILPFLSLTSATYSQNPLPRHVSNPEGITVPVYNDLAHQHYLINLTVGTPPSLYAVLLDTGSTDFWLPLWNSSGCNTTCRPGTFDPSKSSTALDIHIPFNVTYGLTPGSGLLGEYYKESITIGDANLPTQTFAVTDVPAPITDASLWGILGLGSRYGTSSFTSSWSPIYHQLNATYTPLWENLYESNLVPKRLFSLTLGPQSATFGSITFGSISEPSSGLYTDELLTTPVLLSGPLFTGWIVNLASVTRSTSTPPSSNSTTPYPETETLTPGNSTLLVVLDSGSPNMYLPTALYAQISAPLSPTSRTNPEGNPTPYVPCSYRSPLASNATTLAFTFPGTDNGTKGPTIEVPLAEIIYPFGLPSNMGEVRGADGEELCYFGIVPTEGQIYLLGATFLRSAYAVFSGEGGEWGVSMAQARYE